MNYRLYSADMAKSLARIASQASVQRDADYYKANIGKVKSPDDLLKDQRLYAYAMKAYGLEDQVQSKGLMRKVLESDLSQSDSFANKLVDKRYREFAAAFQFGSASKAAVQTAAQTELVTEAYSEHRVRAANKAGEVVDLYNQKITTVTSVADLLNDPTMLRVVAKVAGLDPEAADQTALKATLSDALTNGASSSTNAKLRDLQARFQFQSAGSPNTGLFASPPQTASALADMAATYFDETGFGNSPQAAAYKTNYVRGVLAANPTSQALTQDDQVLDYVLTAFGIDPASVTPSQIKDVLNADTSTTPNALSSMPTTTSDQRLMKDRLTALHAAFNYNTSGNASGSVFASSWSMDRLQSSYYEGYRADDLAIDKLRTATFEARLSNMKSINNLLNRDALGTRATLDYVLTAFDIDPSTESNFKLRQVLMSDPSDPNSFVSKLKDERYEKLAAAFNFGADGKPTTQRLVQSVSSQTATGTLYATSFGTDVNAAKKDIIKADTQAYLKAVGEMRSLDDFIADKTSIKYALKAYGLADEKISDADLRKLFTSDLADPKSFANAKADKRYVKLVSAFNFTPDGRVRRDAEGAQSGFTLLTTQNKFLLQTMESQVGQQSEGARLALYFLRKAPDVTSAYGILADKALFEVARTALGLPAGISGMEIESQAKLLESKINFKYFQDPKKLDKFITRFSSLYDSANSSAASSPILSLFGNSAGSNGILGYL